MKRRLFLAVGLSALLVATLTPGGVLAKMPTATNRIEGLSKIDPSFKPAALDLKKKVDVYVKLADEPVAVAQGKVLDAASPRKLSTGERAVIRAGLASKQAALAPRIERLGGKITGRFRDAVNAMRVTIARGRLSALSHLPGVVSVSAVRRFALDNTNTDNFIGATNAWAAGNGYAGYAGYAGGGIKIASLDTGIDYYHANFGGSGNPADFACDDGLDRTGCALAGPGVDTFPTAKVIEGYDFVGDCYNASEDPTDPSPPTTQCPGGFSDIPVPDNDPLDCQGHGSHTAGTAAGFGVVHGATDHTYTGPYNTSTLSSNTFVIGPGVAPRAKILAYRVFGCEGSTSVVVDAIDRAIQDDADVITMSLGSVFGRDDELDSEASNNASLAGVVVVASAGNSGASAYITGDPAAASRAISVAAIDAVPSFPTAIVDFATEADEQAINANNGDLTPAITATLRKFADDGTTSCNATTGAGCENLGCDDGAYTYNATLGYTAGDVAVVDRGICARVQKAQVGDANGAIAVIMINNAAGLPPFEGPIEGVTIPFLGVSSAAAPKFTAENGNPATLDNGPVIANPTYGFLASFTSGGPRNGDSAVKPDVTAPGVSVISTLVGGGAQGTTMSGTSMAAPATAGVAALVRQAHPSWRPTRVKAAIVGTADSNLIASGTYTVRTGGAGVVKPRRAVDTKSVITTEAGNTNLDFGYAQPLHSYSESRTATLRNVGSASITYNLSIAFNGGHYGFTGIVSPSSVTLAAGASATITVTLAASAATLAAMPGSIVPVGGFTPLTVVKGNLVATPTTAGPGLYPVRSPFLLAPRALSAIQAGQKTPYTPSGPDVNASIGLINGGVHSGDADVYAWGLTDRNEGYASGDLRAVGVQSFECLLDGGACYDGGPPNDRFMVFAINTWGRWSNQSTDEYDIAIDTAPCPPAKAKPASLAPVCEDSDPEFFLVAIDFGALLAGAFDGRMLTALFDANGDPLYLEYLVPEAPNGSTIEAAMVASDLGIGPSVQAGTPAPDEDFNYTVASFSIVPGSSQDFVTNEAGNAIAFAGFDPWDPAVSQGDFITIAPAGAATLPLTVHRPQQAANPARGWMAVTVDDANGKPQADLIPIGSIPPIVP
jgi:minor extracellular serine protease Vpr